MTYRLLVISPCRDEARFLEGIINSVVQQTHRPVSWIVVDDGSQDNTFAIISRHAAQHSWIKPIRRERGGQRQLGPGVVDAFNAGLAAAGQTEYDIIAKLDCDLEFSPECFAAILRPFRRPPGRHGQWRHLFENRRPARIRTLYRLSCPRSGEILPPGMFCRHRRPSTRVRLGYIG